MPRGIVQAIVECERPFSRYWQTLRGRPNCQVVVSRVFSVVMVVFSLHTTLRSDAPVHISTPRPRATATDQFEACAANHVLHR